MNNLFTTNVYDSNFDNHFIKFLYLHKNNTNFNILIDSQFECYDFLQNNTEYKKLIDHLRKFDKKPLLLLSHTLNQKQLNDVELIYFPEAFFKYCYQHLFIPNTNQSSYNFLYKNQHLLNTVAKEWYNNHTKIIKEVDDLNYKYHFINLNFKTHYHRKVLIDQLAKNSLIEKNAITWQDVKSPKIESDYVYKYFNNNKIHLSGNFSHLIDTGIKPQEYYTSFCEIVSESSYDYSWITEKTAAPLIIGKPFLVVGSVNFHEKLKNMGFELFDDIFNYDFDKEPDLEIRVKGLVDNLINLQNIPLSKLSLLHSKIKNKIKHNQNLAKLIAFDDSLYPDVLKNIIEVYKIDKKNLNPYFISMYENLCKLKQLYTK